jgi:hypothetical protein
LHLLGDFFDSRVEKFAIEHRAGYRNRNSITTILKFFAGKQHVPAVTGYIGTTNARASAAFLHFDH